MEHETERNICDNNWLHLMSLKIFQTDDKTKLYISNVAFGHTQIYIQVVLKCTKENLIVTSKNYTLEFCYSGYWNILSDIVKNQKCYFLNAQRCGMSHEARHWRNQDMRYGQSFLILSKEAYDQMLGSCYVCKIPSSLSI